VLLTGAMLGCGPSLLSGDGEGEGEGSTGPGATSSGLEGSDTGVAVGTSGSDQPDVPPDPPVECQLAPLEVFDIEALVGEETVVQELEVLDSGEVLVAGYFGLARGSSTHGDFELLDAPEVLSSSFGRLVRGADRELWASAFGQLAYSPDAGETWQTWTLPHDALVYRIYVAGEERIYLGGDAILGTFAAGESSWTLVPELDSDRGGISYNNMIRGLAWRDGWLVAAERFGLMARSIDGESWSAIDGPRLSEPELIDLGEHGLLLWSSAGDVHRSDDGSNWTEHGLADTWPAVASNATQLAHRAGDDVLFGAGSNGLQVSCDLGASWQTLPLGTESDVIYDVSVGADGSLWAAGFNEVFRIGP